MSDCKYTLQLEDEHGFFHPNNLLQFKYTSHEPCNIYTWPHLTVEEWRSFCKGHTAGHDWNILGFTLCGKILIWDQKPIFQSSLWFVPICPSYDTSTPPIHPSTHPSHTHTHSPPAFRKARLTLIGCTDPFLWIWIKVRQATHAKLCQAGPHAHTSSHRVTKKVEGGGKRGGERGRRDEEVGKTEMMAQGCKLGDRR